MSSARSPVPAVFCRCTKKNRCGARRAIGPRSSGAMMARDHHTRSPAYCGGNSTARRTTTPARSDPASYPASRRSDAASGDRRRWRPRPGRRGTRSPPPPPFRVDDIGRYVPVEVGAWRPGRNHPVERSIDDLEAGCRDPQSDRATHRFRARRSVPMKAPSWCHPACSTGATRRSTHFCKVRAGVSPGSPGRCQRPRSRGTGAAVPRPPGRIGGQHGAVEDHVAGAPVIRRGRVAGEVAQGANQFGSSERSRPSKWAMPASI